MIKKLSHKNMGRSQLGWLDSHFHFSFAEYYNPKNMHFGVLRVLNDDLIAPHTGFDTHPHKDMEIISYVIDGQLSHADSMGNEHTLSRGQVQYMSAGTGVFHSEHNHGEETARLLQLWIIPDQKGHQPNYGDYRFAWSERDGNWLHMVSPMGGKAPIGIHQDANIYALSLEPNEKASFSLDENRQLYLIQIEGDSLVNGHKLETRDALESIEESLEIEAISASHFLAVEMAKYE